MSLRLMLTQPPALPADLAAAMVFGERQVLRIGRQAVLDWVLPDPTLAVSGQHCEIRRDPLGYTLYDLSTNGTFLNGETKRVGEARSLANGDRIAVGPYVMTVELAAVEGDADETVIISAGRPSRSLVIRVVDGPTGVSASPIEAILGSEGTLVIGRDTKAGLVLPDTTALVSRRHCEIRVENGAYLLYEVSTNGTFRAEGGERVPSGMTLGDGDRLRIGGFVLQVAIAGVAAKIAGDAAVEQSPVASTAVLPRRGAEPGTVMPPAIPSSGMHVSAGAAHDLPELTAIIRPPVATAPRTAPVAAAAAPPAATPATVVPTGGVVDRVAKALGLSAFEIGETDPAALAEQLATIVAVSVSELKPLLAATQRRQGSTQVANPIDALPNAEEAIRIMFGPPRRSYLDARRAVKECFVALREEQNRAPAAMRDAAAAFADTLSPDAVEQSVGNSGVLGKLVGKRKTKLWDRYIERWASLTGGKPDGAAETFKRLFAEKLGGG
ncbi:FHA domain-containing protein [Acidisphaera sp. L21]|uniref:FHA domain-containing protein n=1 Tax=Acidisphaera sp. L21 TaxID=1641851 RepID=UPI00131AA2E7|nr:FHA domain-containing protein [Acidisphaera sp. L21]